LRRFVLDASITLGWMLDRPIPARSALTRKLIIGGDLPVVPLLWRHEVANAVVISERRGRLSADQVRTLMGDLEEFSGVVEVDPVYVRISSLIETAQRASLTACDATYLELAVRRRLPLATLGDKLRDAARQAGVELI